MKWNTRSALYGAALLTAVNLFAQAVGFVYRVCLARLIGAEGLGLLALVTPVHSVLLSLVVSGLTVAVSRLSAGYAALDNTLAVRQLVRRALSVFLLLWCAVALPVILFSDGISVALLGDARTRTGLLLLLPCLLLTGIENIHKNHFYGLKKIHPPALSEILENLVRTGAVLTLLHCLRPSYEEYAIGLVVLGMVICEVVSAVLLRTLYRRSQRGRRAAGPGLPRRRMLSDMAAIAVPFALSSLLSNCIGAAGSVMVPARLMAAGLTADEALSSYGVVVGMTMPLLSLPLAFAVGLSLVMIPRLSEDLALRRFASIRRRVTRTLALATAALLPSMALLALAGPDLARLLFRQAAAGLYIPPLALGTVFACYHSILSSLLSALGLQTRAAANAILAGLLQLALTWLGAAQPRLGIGGFVYAFLIASALGALLCTLDLRRFLRAHAG
ncbi:MAG: oligosaccharide flippase family protein [Oscillospiraceae bacterium]|nr:oligosaccharide flippase family protein [Oscillospiraceae bacterium]